MPSCQVFSAKRKAHEELDKWQSWWETYEADEIVDLCPDPKTMRMSPSKPPTPKKKQPQGDPPAQPPAPPQEDEGPAEATAQAGAPAAAAQEEEAPAPAPAAQEDDAPAPPQEEEAPAAAPQEGEGAAPKEEEAPEGATPEGDPSPQKEGDAAPAATGAEEHRPEWEKEWEAEVVVQTIKEITELQRALYLVHSARCKYVARATLLAPMRTSTVAHFSDLSESVFACVLGWVSNRECF